MYLVDSKNEWNPQFTGRLQKPAFSNIFIIFQTDSDWPFCLGRVSGELHHQLKGLPCSNRHPIRARRRTQQRSTLDRKIRCKLLRNSTKRQALCPVPTCRWRNGHISHFWQSSRHKFEFEPRQKFGLGHSANISLHLAPVRRRWVPAWAKLERSGAETWRNWSSWSCRGQARHCNGLSRRRRTVKIFYCGGINSGKRQCFLKVTHWCQMFVQFILMWCNEELRIKRSHSDSMNKWIFV